MLQKHPLSLLENEGILLEIAKKSVHEDGYCYKGQTQSKILNPSSREASHHNQNVRRLMLKNAYAKSRSSIKRYLVSTGTFKSKSRDLSRQFQIAISKCDEVASEMSELKYQQWELETELAGLQLKCKKYHSRKNATRQCDDDDTTQSRSEDPILLPSLPTCM